MSALITIIHVVICLILIIAVLLQSGKAADLAGAFGGAGSQTAFGPRGPGLAAVQGHDDLRRSCSWSHRSDCGSCPARARAPP